MPEFVFYCEHTGVRSYFDLRRVSSVRLKTRLFSSSFCEARHKRKEVSSGSRLVHSNCIYDAASGTGVPQDVLNRVIDFDIPNRTIWVRRNPNRYPRSYEVVLGGDYVRAAQTIPQGVLLPVVAMEQGVSDEAIRVLVEVDLKDHPFIVSDLLHKASVAGKTVRGAYRPLCDSEIAQAMGVTKPNIYYYMLLHNADPCLLCAYDSGMVISKIKLLARLPTGEQEVLLSKAESLNYVELSKEVAARIAELGILNGVRGKGIKYRAEIKKCTRVRSLTSLVALEERLLVVFRNSVADQRVPPRLKGQLQMIQYVLSRIEAPDHEPAL